MAASTSSRATWLARARGSVAPSCRAGAPRRPRGPLAQARGGSRLSAIKGDASKLDEREALTLENGAHDASPFANDVKSRSKRTRAATSPSSGRPFMRPSSNGSPPTSWPSSNGPRRASWRSASGEAPRRRPRREERTQCLSLVPTPPNPFAAGWVYRAIARARRPSFGVEWRRGRPWNAT
jgi:hypothetical protein